MDQRDYDDDEVGNDDDDDLNLYLHVRTETSMTEVLERHDLYLITSRTPDEGVLSPIPGMHHNFPWYSMTTSSFDEEDGSTTIFVLGGMKYARDFKWPYIPQTWLPLTWKANEYTIPMSPELWYIKVNPDDNEIGDDVEINLNNDRWCHGDRMVAPRAEGVVVTVEREIFVFGGNCGYGINVCSEVYDMDSDTWSNYTPDFRLAGFPVTELSACIAMDINDNFGIEFDEEEMDDVFIFDDSISAEDRVMHLNVKAKWNPRRVMLLYISETGCLYAYLMAKNSTRLIDSDFGKDLKYPLVLLIQSGGSCCNNVLLTFKADDAGGVWAYPIGHRKWSLVSGLEGDLVFPSSVIISKQNPVVQFHSLGGVSITLRKRCLIWSVALDDGSFAVLVTKFTLQLDGFSAQVQPTKKYLIRTGLELR